MIITWVLDNVRRCKITDLVCGSINFYRIIYSWLFEVFVYISLREIRHAIQIYEEEIGRLV